MDIELDWVRFFSYTMHVLKGPLMLKGLEPLSLNLMVVAVTYSVLQLTKTKSWNFAGPEGNRGAGEVWKGRGKHLSRFLSPGGTAVCASLKRVPWVGRCCCTCRFPPLLPNELCTFGQVMGFPSLSVYSFVDQFNIAMSQGHYVSSVIYYQVSLSLSVKPLQKLQSITSLDENCCAGCISCYLLSFLASFPVLLYLCCNTFWRVHESWPLPDQVLSVASSLAAFISVHALSHRLSPKQFIENR